MNNINKHQAKYYANLLTRKISSINAANSDEKTYKCSKITETYFDFKSIKILKKIVINR